jgi:hypothetical protein
MLDEANGRAYLAPVAAMTELPLPIQFLAAWIGSWVARRQERLIEYLKEENRVLLEKLGGKVRLTDPERRRLARLGKLIGRKALGEVASIATPDTILRWYRELVARKYDGSAHRGPGRPRTAGDGADPPGYSARVTHYGRAQRPRLRLRSARMRWVASTGQRQRPAQAHEML